MSVSRRANVWGLSRVPLKSFRRPPPPTKKKKYDCAHFNLTHILQNCLLLCTFYILKTVVHSIYVTLCYFVRFSSIIKLSSNERRVLCTNASKYRSKINFLELIYLMFIYYSLEILFTKSIKLF